MDRVEEQKGRDRVLEGRAHIGSLVGRARDGDLQAKEELLDCFQTLFSRLVVEALDRLPNGEREVLDAEVRYLFLSLLCEFDESRGTPFLAYVKKLLTQRLRNFLRNEYRILLREVRFSETVDGEAEVIEYFLSTPESQVLFDEAVLRMWLEQALKVLPGSQRQVMSLALEGFNECEIALRVRLSQPRVHALKRSAIKSLQQQWTDSP